MTFEHFGRSPAAIVELDDLIANMKSFKGRVMGSEQDAQCSQEQLDADFKNLMSSLKKDSCSMDNYSVDKEEFKQKKCPKIKTEGYFDKLVKTTIQQEKAKKPLTYFQNKIDTEFVKINSEALVFLKTIQSILLDDKYSQEDRVSLLKAYNENVLVPVRDVVVIMRSYIANESNGEVYYQRLLPVINANFYENLTPQEIFLITQGEQAQSNPLYLGFTNLNNGQFRLKFSAEDIIRRDVLTLLKAPTAKNYVLALKWMTLNMMVSQAALYDTMLGNKVDINIPVSCQAHFNGGLPPNIRFTSKQGVGEELLESMLVSHGLIYKENCNPDDEECEALKMTYLDYYQENINKDPTKEGYSGLIAFENYKNALRSIEKSGAQALEPQFDDVAHFKTVLSFKMGEAQSVFRGKLKGQHVTYAGYDTFQKMLGEINVGEVAEINISPTQKQEIYPGRQNLSPYLLEVMKANGLTDYSELITERMKKKFVGKKLKLEFPSLYSSPVWRDWSLKRLADIVYTYRNEPENSKVGVALRNACMIGSRKNAELGKICQGNIIKNLSDFMSEFRSGDRYIPTKRLEESKFQEVYPFLGFVWANFRDNLNLIPEATPFEMNFLKEQMEAGNPWARLKFSYMVALDQLEYQQEGMLPKYDRKNPFSKNNDGLRCKINNVSVQYNTLRMAGKVLGLDKSFSYNHSSVVLSPSERKKVWLNIVDDVQQGNAQLFSVKNGSQNYYQTLENISYKTILNEESALSSAPRLSSNTVSEIKNISKQTNAQLAKFFLDLYKTRDVKKQLDLFEQFSEVNGIDNQYSLKTAFMTLDNQYKTPIYKDLLRQAAQTRKGQVLAQLDTFCKMDINDEVTFKNIFYSSTKAQNDLNKMAGLPGVPEEVLSKVNEMTASEWRDLWMGIGSGLAGMGAVVIAGACTAFTGPICAPLGGIMAVAGLSAMGIQINLTSNELDRKSESDSAQKQIKLMEDLGFANLGSNDEVHRSYFWATFEAISIFPLIGIATRSAVLGPKLAIVSAQNVMKRSGVTAFKQAAKTAVQEEEVRTAQFLLGFDKAGKHLGISEAALEQAKVKISKIGALYKSGDINLETMMSKTADVLAPFKKAKMAIAKTVRSEIGHVTIRKGEKEIDDRVASMTANYFSDNPKAMLRFIQGYSGERLDKAIRVMSEINAVDRVAGRIPIYSGAKDWFMRMRHEDLAKNASKILRIERELLTLGSKPGQLESFINKNISDISDIMMTLPFKKREIPYFIFAQGIPEFNFLKGRRIPILSEMSRGQTIKRIFLARSRLIQESINAQQRAKLGLKHYVHSETTLEVFKRFQYSIAELANNKTGAESVAILRDLRIVEEKLARKLYAQFTNKNKAHVYKNFKEMILQRSVSKEKAEFEAFKDMVFNPVSLKDKAQAQAIWESLPADELFRMKELSDVAHKAAQQLSKYSDIDSFESYLNALKVIVINRNSAVLEIM